MFPTVIRAAAGPRDPGTGGRDDEESMAEVQSNPGSTSDTVSSLVDDDGGDDRSSVASIDSGSDIVTHNVTAVRSL